MKTIHAVLLIGVAAIAGLAFFCWYLTRPAPLIAGNTADIIPSIYLLPADSSGTEIRYGRELIARTAAYLGPGGSVQHSSNGMACQNCHLDAGTRFWGNSYLAVAATYPKFRPRSGTKESIAKRVNDCFERSLNGGALDTGSREMHAIIAYIRWLGQAVPKGAKPDSMGIVSLPLLERAADPEKGRAIYAASCVSCHGAAGQGLPDAGGKGYQYPPLWGPHSYNSGAGLYGISRLAGYVRDNMPLGSATHRAPQLSDEQAWDVAAFINSQPRPSIPLLADWPDISKKTFDYPFGPYTDSFSERQHKYGPFGPIQKAHERKKGA